MAAELPEWVKKSVGQEQTVGMRNGPFYLYDVEYSCDRTKIFGIKTAGTLDEIGGIIPGRRKPDAKGTIVTSFEYGATDALEVPGTDYAKASVGSLGLKMAMMPSWPWPIRSCGQRTRIKSFLCLSNFV